MEPQYPPTLSQNQQSCDDLYEEEGHIYGARQDTSVPLSDQYHLQVSTESSPQDRGNNDEGAILPQSLSLPLLEDTAVSRQLLSAQNEAFPDATVQHGQLHPHFLSGLTDEYYTLLPLQQQPVFQPTMGYQFQVDFPVMQSPAPTLPPSFSSPQQQPLVVSRKVAKISPEHRKLCCEEGCKNQARAFGRCKRHGGSKRCSSPGCDKSVQSRGLCIRHGGGSRCQENGCTRASQSSGKCKLHGGGRPCSVAGCEKRAHLKRLCRKHGGGIKCSVAGCEKWAQRQSMCIKHVKEMQQADEM